MEVSSTIGWTMTDGEEPEESEADDADLVPRSNKAEQKIFGTIDGHAYIVIGNKCYDNSGYCFVLICLFFFFKGKPLRPVRKVDRGNNAQNAVALCTLVRYISSTP